MKNYAVVFLAWGEKYINEVYSCITQSEKFLQDYDLILITDLISETKHISHLLTKVIRAEFEEIGLQRKTELHKFIPSGYKSYLFLDSDTIVIQDISFGFKKAEIHGIALSPAPHYSLDAFWGFDEIMSKEKELRRGQLQYNTGVIFFNSSPIVKEVFSKWRQLGNKYKYFKNDQPFFTLAMEQLIFNPYTLSISYNYRGFGDSISGDVRIWHSHGSMPKELNSYKVTWPPRRAWPGRVEEANLTSEKRKGFWTKLIR